MGSKKLRPFAEILILEKQLSDDQRLDLLDVLRGRPQRAAKSKAAKPKDKEPKEAKPTKAPICATCGNVEDFADHKPESDVFHKFRTEIKTKAAGESK